MSDESDDKPTFTRRKLVALLGGGVVGLTTGKLTHGGAERENSKRDQTTPTEPARTPGGEREPADDEPANTVNESPENPISEKLGDESVRRSDRTPGVNIEEHGAEPNPEDSSREVAERNLDAIIAAANAAGDNGAIYVPAGTYHFGHEMNDAGPFLSFGNREPSGISIYGAGPGESTLAVTSHVKPATQHNQTGFYYSEEFRHGTVEIENITLDGNHERIGNLSAVGGGSRGVDAGGVGDFHLFNVHVRGWYMAGVRGRGSLRSIVHCRLEDNGIRRHNDTSGNGVSHHVACRPTESNPLTVANCRFKDCSGSAINVRFNDGTVRVYDCHVTGTGANFCKLSAGKRLELKNVYHKANTDSLERKVKRFPGKVPFHGRDFIHSFGERASKYVTVYTEHVKTCNTGDVAFMVRDNYGLGPPDVNWKGDMVAFQNITQERDIAAIRSENGSNRANFRRIQVGRLSIHDADGVMFETEDANGQIDTLRHDRTEGLGHVGNVKVVASEGNAEPFQPDLPSPENVGILTQ